MVSEKLSTMVDRGWAIMPLARRALLTLADDPFPLASVGDLGRRLFPLAKGFDCCGQPVSARLVLGLSEAFIELAHQNLVPSDQVMELLRTAVNQLEDLLVELDATGQTTTAQPIDTMMRLEATAARQRMIRLATTGSGREATGIDLDSCSELHRCGDALFAASETLLGRVQRDDASPYFASVSMIHHLAGVLRERLIENTAGLPPANEFGRVAPLDCLNDGCATASESAEKPCEWESTLPQHCFSADSEAVARRSAACDDADSTLPPTCRPPKVLIIDESPFFRMLLGAAVESTGHAMLSLASLDEAEAQLNDTLASDIVVWGGIDCSTLTDCLTEWIVRRDDSRRPMLIGLVDGVQSPDGQSAQFDRIVCRIHLHKLLSIIRNRLDNGLVAIMKSA